MLNRLVAATLRALGVLALCIGLVYVPQSAAIGKPCGVIVVGGKLTYVVCEPGDTHTGPPPAAGTTTRRATLTRRPTTSSATERLPAGATTPPPTPKKLSPTSWVPNRTTRTRIPPSSPAEELTARSMTTGTGRRPMTV